MFTPKVTVTGIVFANTMKQHLFSVVILIALSSVASAQDAKLTVDLAKKLLPQAAGISNADFKTLSKDPRPEVVKSKSLSLVLLALRLPMNPDPDADKEFRILGDDFRVSDVTQAMWLPATSEAGSRMIVNSRCSRA